MYVVRCSLLFFVFSPPLPPFLFGVFLHLLSWLLLSSFNSASTNWSTFSVAATTLEVLGTSAGVEVVVEGAVTAITGGRTPAGFVLVVVTALGRGLAFSVGATTRRRGLRLGASIVDDVR